MAGLMRDRCRSPGRRRRSHGRALVECVPVGLPPPSLLDQLVCDMQRHLEEMERVRAVLFDAYPCLTPSPSLLCSNSSCPIRAGASSSRRNSRRPAPPDEDADEDPSGKGYAFSVDVTGFTPEQLTVRLEGRRLIVTGRHDRKQDAALDGCVSREYREVRKELSLPADADLERLTCTFNPDNDCLCIQAPRQHDKGPERNIPISIPGQPPAQSLPPAKESGSAPTAAPEESKDGAPSAAAA